MSAIEVSNSSAIQDKELFYTSLHKRISQFEGDILASKLEIGYELYVARTCYPVHDARELYEWINTRMGINRAAAKVLMRCGNFYHKNRWLKEYLPQVSQTVIFEMSSPQLPAAKIDDLQGRMLKGENIKVSEVKRLLLRGDQLSKDAMKEGSDGAAAEMKKASRQISLEGMRKNLVKIQNSLSSRKIRQKQKKEVLTLKALAKDIMNTCDLLIDT